ncbi:MAG: hypothetical protein ABIO72_06025 [Patescibacteria group bacterium]
MPAHEKIDYAPHSMYGADEFYDGCRQLFLFSPEPEEEITPLDALIQLEDLGFRGIVFPELVSFAANWPEEPLGYSILALASVGRFGGMSVLPALSCTASGRGLMPIPSNTRMNYTNHRYLTTARL